MKTIKVGGVPEHFNFPWHYAIKNEAFKKEDLNILWTDFPDGTGAMNKALRNGEIDVAVILTEGVIKDIIAGNESRIIQNFIGSPLLWGIHVAANSPYKQLEDLLGKTAAISREGSGSHLMAYINAQNQHWETSGLKFEIVETIEGAITSLQKDSAQYFMWEHFTTKPWVDNGTFRRLADCPTPWPCFVIAARSESIQQNPEELNLMLQILNATTKNFKDLPNIDEKLAKNYGQKLEDIRQWLDLTHWSQKQIEEEELEKVQNNLLDLSLIPEVVATKYILQKL